MHEFSAKARLTKGLKAKLLNKARHAEKVQMKKTIKMHEEKLNKQKDDTPVPDGAIPAYLMDRQVLPPSLLQINSPPW